MKPNVKSAGALKSFFLTHGEKLGMAVIAGLAGWVLYSSLSPQGESRQPTELGTRVSNSRSTIENFSVDQALEAEGPEEGIKQADSWQPIPLKPVEADQLASGKDPWYPSIRPKVQLREDPVLLAPTQPEGHGGTALMATLDDATAEARLREQARQEADRALNQRRQQERDQNQDNRRGRGGRGGDDFAAGGGMQEGQRPVNVARPMQAIGVQISDTERVDLVSYAVVTALVPVEEQVKMYEDSFAEARGYDSVRDMPQWVGYEIERMEVGAGEDNWRPVGVRDSVKGNIYPIVFSATINRMTMNWVDGMEPLMDQNYAHPELTMPLLPLVGKNFGREAVHSQVPLQRETDAAMAERDQNNPVEEGGNNPLDMLGAPDVGAAGQGGRGRGGRGAPGQGGRSRGRGEFFGDAGEFGEFGDRGGGGRGGRGGGGRGAVQMGGEFNYSAPYAMLRFFDLDVTAGKRYRYRVKLILKDPNHRSMVSGSDLSKEVRARVDSAKDEFVRTDWSEPTPVISIPAAGDVLVDNVKPASTRSPNDEPTASLLVRSFDVDENNRGRQAEKIMSFQRGSVLNKSFGEDEIELLVPGGRFLEKSSFNFKTNVTVVDIDGGEKLNRELTRPGRVLLMDSTGRLMVADELDGLDEVELHKEIFAEEDPRSRRGRDDNRGRGGGEFGEFFEMGGRGGR